MSVKPALLAMHDLRALANVRAVIVDVEIAYCLEEER